MQTSSEFAIQFLKNIFKEPLSFIYWNIAFASIEPALTSRKLSRRLWLWRAIADNNKIVSFWSREGVAYIWRREEEDQMRLNIDKLLSVAYALGGFMWVTYLISVVIEELIRLYYNVWKTSKTGDNLHQDRVSDSRIEILWRKSLWLSNIIWLWFRGY